MALTATIGGATSDTYATMAQYQAYALNYYNVTITDDADSEAHLRQAARYLDNGYTWAGYPTNQTQALAWPRYVNILVDGWPVDSDTIPQAILDAQCEMAYRISLGATPYADLDGGAVKREKVDVIETEYAQGTERDRVAFPAVDALVGPYVTGKVGGKSGSLRVARG